MKPTSLEIFEDSFFSVFNFLIFPFFILLHFPIFLVSFPLFFSHVSMFLFCFPFFFHLLFLFFSLFAVVRADAKTREQIVKNFLFIHIYFLL